MRVLVVSCGRGALSRSLGGQPALCSGNPPNYKPQPTGLVLFWDLSSTPVSACSGRLNAAVGCSRLTLTTRANRWWNYQESQEPS